MNPRQPNEKVIQGPWTVGAKVYFVHESVRRGPLPDYSSEFDTTTVFGVVKGRNRIVADVLIDDTNDTIQVDISTGRPLTGHGYSSFYVIPYLLIPKQAVNIPPTSPEPRPKAHLTDRDALALDNIIADVEDGRVSVEAATAYAAALFNNKLRKTQRDALTTFPKPLDALPLPWGVPMKNQKDS